MTLRRKVIAATSIVLVALAVLWSPRLARLYRVNHLFDEDRIVENFLHVERVFPLSTMTASPDPLRFGRGTEIDRPASFEYEGKTVDTEAYFDATQVTGLLVLKDGRIVLEDYYRGFAEEGHHISWSMAKSFVSALVGIALDDRAFGSIEDPVTLYVPELKGSGYDGVRIKDILQMSSGVLFDEDYGDFDSDINRLGRVLALGGSLDEFAASLGNEVPPGTRNHYVSIDTQVLAMLLVRVTGRSITEYMQEKLWHPLGMEYPGSWVLDDDGMELAFGTLNASLRDYAKLGWLYLNGGRRDSVQIVPADWVRASVTPDAPHLLPTDSKWGYGYQWWIPSGPDGEFMAVGIRGQFIYVYPRLGLVIVKTAANHDYTNDQPRYTRTDLALFRTIAAGFAADSTGVAPTTGDT